MVELLKFLIICVLIGNTLSSAPFVPEYVQETDKVSSSGFLETQRKLHSSYIQAGGANGYQRADLAFDTTIPSLNPFRTGAIKRVSCSPADNSITLTLKNRNFLKMASNWPSDDVLLLVDHQWDCFGKKTTQFFLASNKTLDRNKGEVKYQTKPCDVMKWSEKFSLDVTWVQPKQSKQNSRRRRRSSMRGRDLSGPISDDQETTIPLNFLFDNKTGGSSMPNMPLISIGQSIGTGNVTGIGESLVCKNCFIKGQATISLHIEGQAAPEPQISNATLSIDGNLLYNFDMAVNGQLSVTGTTPDIQILEVPLTPLAIPNVFNVGPSLILAASAQVSTSITGTLYTGGIISYPNFHMSVSLLDSNNPQFEQSGFDAQTQPIDPHVGVTTTVGVAGNLKPQLALSVDVLNGLLQAKTGFGLTATLGADVTVGSESGCSNDTTPNIRTYLGGGLGFFVQSFTLPAVNFPELNIASVCV